MTGSTYPGPVIRVYTFGKCMVERLLAQEVPLPQYIPVGDEEWGKRNDGRKLLKLLLCSDYRRAPRDVLLEMLWPDAGKSHADRYLNSAAWTLRKVLRGPGGQSLLRTVRPSSAAHAKPSALNTTILDRFENLIGECWELSNQNELEAAESILSSFLPKILALPSREGRTAYLASQGLRLQSVLVHHRLKISDKVLMCEQSADYARYADDTNTLVAALLELAIAYKYNGQSDKWFKTLQEALYYSPKASPLVQSPVYFKSAIAFAYHKRNREAELYIQMAFDTFPDHPELDPGYALADSSIYTLSRDAGRARLEMGQTSDAYSAFETYKQHPSSLLIPERLRLEIVNGLAKAAIQEHDLEKYAHFLESGIVGAIALVSVSSSGS